MTVTTEVVEAANLKGTGPSIRLAPSYAGWLRKFAFKQDELRAAVLRNAAEVIELQRVEIYRLRIALEEATDGVSASPSDTLPPKATDVRGRDSTKQEGSKGEQR